MKNWKGALLAVFLTAILLFVYYSHQIIDADKITYGAGGDGYKNYYTLAYYLKYDTGAKFTGMDYPFGENVLFTDNQPAVAWILKLLTYIFPSLIYHIHGYIGWAFFLALLLSTLFIYKTFRQFNMDEYNAAIFATLIVMMSPQMQRLGSHFSLSYTCYIPIMLYFLVRFFKSDQKVKYFLLALLVNCFFIFIHIYYAAMTAMYYLLAAMVYVVVNRKDLRRSFNNAVLLGIVAVMPFVLLKSFLLITDKLNDRPKAPWGFIENRSTVEDILCHPHSFTGELLSKILPADKIVYHFEGEGYIGLVTVIAIIICGILCIRSKQTRIKLLQDLYPFNLFIIPAIIIVLFAMAFPFCLDPLEKYYAKMPSAIKQFRAAGRFNWYFYYTATIMSSLVIYWLFKFLLISKKGLAYVLLVSVYGVWFIEANMMSNRQNEEFNTYSAEFSEYTYLDELNQKFHSAGKDASDFQAILPIPIFLNGSEKLYIESSVAFIAMKQSLILGLPIAGCQMSRTSLSQTLQMANLLSDPLIKKEVLQFYKSNKPLLIITHGTDLSKQEKALLEKGRFLFEQRGNRYFQLDLSAFKDSIQETKNLVKESRTQLINHGEYLTTNPLNNVIVKRFENEPKSYAIFGQGAHYSERDINYFYFDTLPAATDSTAYEISFWVYSDNRRPAYPVLYISQTDTTGKEVGKAEYNPKYSTNSYRDWVRGTIDFTLYNHHNKILLTESDVYASFDEIMIRPKSVNVITQWDNDSTFIFNNYPIR